MFDPTRLGVVGDDTCMDIFHLADFLPRSRRRDGGGSRVSERELRELSDDGASVKPATKEKEVKPACTFPLPIQKPRKDITCIIRDFLVLVPVDGAAAPDGRAYQSALRRHGGSNDPDAVGCALAVATGQAPFRLKIIHSQTGMDVGFPRGTEGSVPDLSQAVYRFALIRAASEEQPGSPAVFATVETAGAGILRVWAAKAAGPRVHVESEARVDLATLKQASQGTPSALNAPASVEYVGPHGFLVMHPRVPASMLALDVEKMSLVRSWSNGHRQGYSCWDMSTDQKTGVFYSVSNDGCIFGWDARSQSDRPSHEHQIPGHCTLGVQCFSERHLLAVGCGDSFVRIFDTRKTGEMEVVCKCKPFTPKGGGWFGLSRIDPWDPAGIYIAAARYANREVAVCTVHGKIIKKGKVTMPPHVMKQLVVERGKHEVWTRDLRNLEDEIERIRFVFTDLLEYPWFANVKCGLEQVVSCPVAINKVLLL